MQAEVSDSNSAAKLWIYWFYEWAEHEYPDGYHERVWFQGPFQRGTTLNKQVRPGVAAGYITMTPSDPEKYVGMDVIVRFNPKEIIKEMSTHLSEDILVEHWLAMEERGWTWTK